MEGILNEVKKLIDFGNVNIENNEIVIVISPEDFKNFIIKNIDEKFKNYITIEMKEPIKIKIRLL